jgi:thymidine phosphorylase
LDDRIKYQVVDPGALPFENESFDAVDVIVAKRDRRELSDGQIDWVVGAYTRGVVADEQMSSLAMAILLNGMNRREISAWTAAMIASGVVASGGVRWDSMID